MFSKVKKAFMALLLGGVVLSNAVATATVTNIVLSDSGSNTISSSGTCPSLETTSIVIDGSSYTNGPGVITLYDCSIINSDFDIIDIQLIGFAEGLWIELEYKATTIDLVIRSLDDYSGYWTRVKTTYVTNYLEQASTEHFPNFSWDKVPRWISFRKNPNVGPFTDEEINSIATNNELSWYGLGTPEEVITMAERIKSVKQNYKMMLYWNAESYWGTTIDTFAGDAWLLPDETGSGERTLYDHTIPEMREWWVNHALLMDSNDAIDGVFSDNTREPADSLKSQMIEQLANSLPSDSLKMGNFLRQRDDDGNRWRMVYEDGSYFENQHIGPINQPAHESIIVSMHIAREASWKKKLVMWNGSRRNCGCATLAPADIPDYCVGFMNVNAEPLDLIQQDLDLSLAEYLMAAGEFSYFGFNISPDASCEKWRWDTSHLAEFQKPLGLPLGPPLRIGNTFSRHFEHLSVSLDLDAEETVFIWDDTVNPPSPTPPSPTPPSPSPPSPSPPSPTPPSPTPPSPSPPSHFINAATVELNTENANPQINLSHVVGSAAESLDASLYQYDCSTPVASDDPVTIVASSVNLANDVAEYAIEFDRDTVLGSSLIVGQNELNLCVIATVGSSSASDIYRASKISLTFDLEQASFFLEVNGATPDTFDLGDISLYYVNACVCSTSFTCDESTSFMQENDLVSVCLWPSSPGFLFKDFSMSISGKTNGFTYSPITFSNGVQTPDSSTTLQQQADIWKVTTQLSSGLFDAGDGGSSQAVIEGTGFLEYVGAKSGGLMEDERDFTVVIGLKLEEDEEEPGDCLFSFIREKMEGMKVISSFRVGNLHGNLRFFNN